MVCQTIKPGVECAFMSPKGCTYNGGQCYPIVEACQGCNRVKEFPSGLYCTTFSEPRLKWVAGPCNMATNIVKTLNNNGVTKKVNPLKASKRSRS